MPEEGEVEIETSGSGEGTRGWGGDGESLQLRGKLTSLQSNFFLKNTIESICKSARPALVGWSSAATEVRDADPVL